MFKTSEVCSESTWFVNWKVRAAKADGKVFVISRPVLIVEYWYRRSWVRVEIDIDVVGLKDIGFCIAFIVKL